MPARPHQCRRARNPAALPAKKCARIPAAVPAGALIAAGESIEALLAALPPQALPLRLTPQEALFFQCLIEATAAHGVAPPPPLDLPASIVRVVDYEHLKAFMARKMLREEDNTEEGKKRHRERVKSALKRAREALTVFKVVGVNNPYIWWTGKPVCGLGLRSYTASS